MTIKTTIDEQNSWVDNVYLIDVNDLALGYDADSGEIGIANQQGQDLANRTLFLKNFLEKQHSLAGEHALTNADFNPNASLSEDKLQLAFSTASLNSMLDALDVIIDSTEGKVDTIRESTLQLFAAVAKAIPLSWVYSNRYFDFELFLQNGELTLQDVNPVTVANTISGDDSIDVEDTSGLEVGRSYIVHDGAGNNPQVITVEAILSPTRVLCTEVFPYTMQNGKLACTSWDIPESGGVAYANSGSMFLTRPIVGLTGYSRGKFVLRGNTTPANITVQSKEVGASLWEDCDLIDSISRESGYTDYEFSCPGGDIELLVTVTLDSAIATLSVKNMCVMPQSEYALADDVRQPNNISPAEDAISSGETPTLTGSPYYSLYGYPQGGAQFQVSTDYKFFNLAVNATTTGTGVSYSVPAEVLSADVVYFWRCRYKDSEGVWSRWSDYTKFSTSENLTAVAAPVNASPSNGQTGVPLSGATLVSSQFKVLGSSPDTHAASYWEVATDSAFSNIIHSSGETTSQKTAYVLPIDSLTAGDQYFWRCKHVGTSLGESPWSSPTTFYASSMSLSIATPTCMSPVHEAVAQSVTGLSLKSSSFRVINGSDTHEMSQWQIYDTADFAEDPSAHLVYGSGYTAGNLITLTVPDGTLSNGGTYFWRVRHKGALAGWSTWSAVSQFSTVIAARVDTPVNVSPAANAVDAATVGLVLSASSFSASNAPGEGHASSEWQISRASSFTSENLVFSSGASETNLTTIRVSSTLSADTTYYWRVRYTGTSVGSSSWSIPTSFRTAVAASIATPTNVAPGAWTTEVPPNEITFEASEFSVQNTTSLHELTQWQIATDEEFSSIVWNSGEVTGTNTFTALLTELSNNTTYYWRVRYKGTVVGWSSWSTPTAFTTAIASYIETPTVASPANNATSFPVYGAVLTSSAFMYVGSAAQHEATRWVIATKASDVYTTVHTGNVTSGNLLAYSLPINALTHGTTYYVKVQHKAADGVWSPYSAWSAFTTVTAAKYFRFYHSGDNVCITGATKDSEGNTYFCGYLAWDSDLHYLGSNFDSDESYGNVFDTPSSGLYTYDESAVVLKYDSSNTLVWRRNIMRAKLYDIKFSTADSKLYACGVRSTVNGTVNEYTPLLVKYSTSGYLEAAKYNTGVSKEFRKLVITSNNKVVVGGRVPNNKGVLIAYDFSLTESWKVMLEDSSFYGDITSLSTSGSRIVASGYDVIYVVSTEGPATLSKLYKISGTNLGIYAVYLDPITLDIYFAGKYNSRSMFGKLSAANDSIEFAKYVNDGSGSKLYDLCKDPYADQFYAVGTRQNGEHATIYKLNFNGTTVVGRVVHGVNDDGAESDRFVKALYDTAKQSVLVVGCLSHESPDDEVGMVLSVLPGLEGLSFSGYNSSPLDVTAAAKLSEFPTNGTLPNANVSSQILDVGATTSTSFTLDLVNLSVDSTSKKLEMYGPYNY